MNTLTLPQARTALEQALRRAGTADAPAVRHEGLLSDPLRRARRDTLEDCVAQLDALLAGMEETGLDAAPEGAAVHARILAERQEVLNGITRYTP